MSSVSPSSSASQGGIAGVPMTLQEFAGFTAIVGKLEKGDSEGLRRLIDMITTDKIVAAYHAYLRKFGAGATSSDVSQSAGSASSERSSGAPSGFRPVVRVGKSRYRGGLYSRTPSPVPLALTARVGVRVPTPSEDGFCYLAGIKAEHREEAARVVGPRPRFFDLLALDADKFDTSAGVKISVVSSGSCHVGSDGTDSFAEVLTAVASRSRKRAASGSALKMFATPGLVKLVQYQGSMVVGSNCGSVNASTAGESVGSVSEEARKLAVLRTVRRVDSVDALKGTVSVLMDGEHGKLSVSLKFADEMKCELITRGPAQPVSRERAFVQIDNFREKGDVMFLKFAVVDGEVVRVQAFAPGN